MNAIKPQKRESSWLAATVAMLCAAALMYGWISREHTYLKPEEGWGYILGIIGASLMVLLLLYPARKKIRFMRNWGSMKIWFGTHMMLGLFGPILVLYHANFGLGSTNSNVALFSMLLVVLSGLIGRFIYRKIHRGLSDHHYTVNELESRLERFHEEFKKWDSFDAATLTSLARLESRARADQNLSMLAAIDAVFLLPWRARTAKIRLNRHIRAQMAQMAAKQKWDNKQKQKAQRYLMRFVRRYFQAVVTEGQLVLYDRIFSWWHIIHMPIFIMLLLSGIFHVIAVHFY